MSHPLPSKITHPNSSLIHTHSSKIFDDISYYTLFESSCDTFIRSLSLTHSYGTLGMTHPPYHIIIFTLSLGP